MKNIIRHFLTISLCSLMAEASSAQAPAVATPPRDNVVIDLSAGLINAAVARDIDQTDKVNDVILGNPVYGTARTRGKVSAVPVPDTNNAVVDLWLRGTIVSDTVAVPPEKKLLIYSTTYICYVVRKRIYVNETGIYAFPTQAQAKAVAKLRKVTNLRNETGTLMTTIAEEAFELQREQSERIAADKARAQLIQNLDEQLELQIALGNLTLLATEQQLEALGVPLRRLHFSSTARQATLGLTLLRPGQNPSYSPAPALPPFDVALRVHQSAVNETAQALLAGKTVNVNDSSPSPRVGVNDSALSPPAGVKGSSLAPRVSLSDPALALRAGVPRAGAASQGGAANLRKPSADVLPLAAMQTHMVQQCFGPMPHDLGVTAVTITFADDGPILVGFADHCVTVTVRIKEIRAGSLRLPGLTLRTAYRIECSPGRAEFVRQGPVQAAPFYHHRIGNRILGAVLQAQLDQVFPPRIELPTVDVAGSIGSLVPSFADAMDGWLTITYVRTAH